MIDFGDSQRLNNEKEIVLLCSGDTTMLREVQVKLRPEKNICSSGCKSIITCREHHIDYVTLYLVCNECNKKRKLNILTNF